jgi:hypothetical protein
MGLDGHPSYLPLHCMLLWWHPGLELQPKSRAAPAHDAALPRAYFQQTADSTVPQEAKCSGPYHGRSMCIGIVKHQVQKHVQPSQYFIEDDIVYDPLPQGFFISNDVKVIGLFLVKSGSWSFITCGWCGRSCGRSCKDRRLCGRQNRLCKTPQRVPGRIYGTRSPGSERFREVLKRESSIGLEKPLNIAAVVHAAI